MNEINLIKSLVDKDQVVIVHKPFVTMCGGSIYAAMMLSQLLYWSDGKTKIHGGWIAKTTNEWKYELCLTTDYEVKMARSVLEKIDVIETVVKKFNGNPTVHYRLKAENFLKLLYSQVGFGEGRQNDLLLDAKSITEITSETTNNTASDEKRPLPDNLPVEWQIAAGVKEIKSPDQKLAQMKDAANLISMGCGSKQQQIYDLAWAFMQARDLVLLPDDAKANRKFAKQMAISGVLPHHVVDAVHHLVAQGMTIVKMSSVAKTAISFANPTNGDNGGHYDYLEGL